MIRIISLSVFIFLFTGCGRKDASQAIEQVFIRSLQENNFDLLKKNLPDMAFYQSLGDKMPKRTDEEIKQFLEESNDRVRVAWQNTLYNAAEKKIDLKKVKVKDVFYYDPFKKDETNEALVVNYEYDNKVWDDLQFIVSRYKDKAYLLAIPNPTRAFSMTDPELSATNEAKAYLEMEKPEFKKNLEALAEKMISFAKENKPDEFGQHLVYRGNDESKKWRTQLNINDSLEKQQADNFMQRVNQNMEGCTNYTTGEIRTERESEGVWIILPLKCENKFVSFAFLRVNDKFLLGDVNSEGQ